MAALDAVCTRVDRGPLGTLSRIKRGAASNPCFTSNETFRRLGEYTVARSTRSCILETVARRFKPVGRSSLREIYKENRLKLAEDYLKTRFQQRTFNLRNSCHLGRTRWLESRLGG